MCKSLVDVFFFIPKSFWVETNFKVTWQFNAWRNFCSSSDPSQANKAIASVRDYLRTTDMVVKESNVGIISGSIEGISGWITINFLKDTIYSAVRVQICVLFILSNFMSSHFIFILQNLHKLFIQIKSLNNQKDWLFKFMKTCK